MSRRSARLTRSCASVFLLVLLFGASLAHAQDKPLIVGTKQAPPFSMQAEDGAWFGLSIELLRDIMGQLDLDHELRGFETITSLLEAVEKGEIDLAVGAITVTAEREQRLDFSHAFHSTGLGIATSVTQQNTILTALSHLASWEFVRFLAVLLPLLLLSGSLVWLIERRRNSKDFGGDPVSGISSGVWWSVVTMTTVGYGDKAPVTAIGRAMAILWMFIGIVLVSVFTASITSLLTVNKLESRITGLEDLYAARVLAIDGSAAESFLQIHGLVFDSVADSERALATVAKGGADAFVHDLPILRYHVMRSYGGRLAALPELLDRSDYAIAFPQGSALREPLNIALIEIFSDSGWRSLLERYLGRQRILVTDR